MFQAWSKHSLLFKYALSIWPSKDLRRSSLDGITRIGRATGGVVCSAPLKLSRYYWIRESVLTIPSTFIGGPRRRGSSSSYNEAGTDSGAAAVGGSRAIRREASASVAQPEADTVSASFLIQLSKSQGPNCGADSGAAAVGGSHTTWREASAIVAQPEVDTGSASFLTLGHLVSSTAYLHASIAGRPYVLRLHILIYSIGKASCRPIGDGEWGSEQRWGKRLRFAHASFIV